MEDDYGNRFTYLQAYKHQVGGHSSMLCLDEATVCKPVVERELLFYRTLPSDLTAFTPRFYGIIKVNVIRQGDYITLVGYTPTWYTPKNSTKHTRLRLRRSGSMETSDIQSISSGNIFEEDQSLSQAPLNTATSSIPSSGHVEKPDKKKSSSTLGVNPWVVKCHRDHLLNLAAAIEAKNTPQNFLVLENLTSKFHFPCILDLKMGTRQYDDTDTLQKRQSKMVKVVTTTSGKLGVRIGGMQVYQVTTGRFLCRNKFYGRSLSIGGFTSALKHFLHDGLRLRAELIPKFIRRLEHLADSLGKQDSLRLYTTSLLLLYEGQPAQPPPMDRLREKRESLKLAMSSSLDGEPTIQMTNNDIERCLSAESLTDLSETEDIAISRRSSKDFLYRRRSSSCTAQQPLSPSDMMSSQQQKEPQDPSVINHSDSLTDVRIIDFAHSTHSGMNESTGVTYNGPDRGFLFGLENMIAILKSIDRDYR